MSDALLVKCTHCKRELPATDFNKDKYRESGLKCWCKVCMSIASSNWQERNKERVAIAGKAWRDAHPERTRELRQKAYKKYRKKIGNVVTNAIASGELVKAPCQECGLDKVDFHHSEGYDKENWLVGVWLCRAHHAQAHKEKRRANWLNLVTQPEQQKKPRDPSIKYRTCTQGHEMTEDNLYIRTNGEKECRKCRKAYRDAWYQNNAEQQRQYQRDFRAKVRATFGAKKYGRADNGL